TLATNVFAGAASCNIAIEFGVMGPNSTNAMSCASGTMAICEGFRQIRDGYADVMICGGVEAPLNQLTFGAFSIIRAMSVRNDDPSHASRPFDRERDGFVMGEGAAVLVLEEYERAKSRGAHIYAEVAGYAFGNDAHHMTAPRPDGTQAARTMRGALRDAHIDAHEIGYVNAHGSSTPLNDPTETRAIRMVFGDHAANLPVSSTKAYYGHALGASGAMEAAICALSLERDWLPPTLNFDAPGEGCDLDYIPGTGRDKSVDYILSNSFGFGGINAALVLQRSDCLSFPSARLDMKDAWRHFAAEFIGIFALVFIGGGAIITSPLLTQQAAVTNIALAHGLILALLVSATMRISGHLNPAV